MTTESQSSTTTSNKSRSKEYRFIDPDRLKKRVIQASRQNLSKCTDDDWKTSDDSATDADELQSQKSSVPPAAFSRVSKYRQASKPADRQPNSATSRLGGTCAHNASQSSGLGRQFLPGPDDVRHTIKSLGMNNYGQLKRAVVDQIDFIKQRDGLWQMSRIYNAMRVLGNFMTKHHFKYSYLPDSQKTWLQDMIKRLDQWSTMKAPFNNRYERRREGDERRARRAKKVAEECHRRINPENFRAQEEKKARSEKRLHEHRVSKILREQDVVERRLDQVDHRSKSPVGKLRLTESDMPISPRTLEAQRQSKPVREQSPRSSPSPGRESRPETKIWNYGMTRQDFMGSARAPPPLKRYREVLRRRIQSSRRVQSFRHVQSSQSKQTSLRVKSSQRLQSFQPSMSMSSVASQGRKAARPPKSNLRLRKGSPSVEVEPGDLMDVLKLIAAVESAQSYNSVKLEQLLATAKQSRSKSGGAPKPDSSRSSSAASSRRTPSPSRPKKAPPVSILTKKSDRAVETPSASRSKSRSAVSKSPARSRSKTRPAASKSPARNARSKSPAKEYLPFADRQTSSKSLKSVPRSPSPRAKTAVQKSAQKMPARREEFDKHLLRSKDPVPAAAKASSLYSPYRTAMERIRRHESISDKDMEKLIEDACKEVCSAIDSYVDSILRQELSGGGRSGGKS